MTSQFSGSRLARRLAAGGAVYGARKPRDYPPLWRRIVDPVAAFIVVFLALLLILSILPVPR
jgi:hypothetical protein